GPGEAPVMHRERNAAGATVVTPCLRWGATAHDLGAVTEDALEAALARALTAPIVVILGPPTRRLLASMSRAGVELLISGVALHPGKRMSYGVVAGDGGRVARLPSSQKPNPGTPRAGPLDRPVDRASPGRSGRSSPCPPRRLDRGPPPHRRPALGRPRHPGDRPRRAAPCAADRLPRQGR